MVKYIQYFFLCCLLVVLPQKADASATASLDQQICSLGESVQLTITVEGDADGEPDLNPLRQQFDILSQSQSSNYSIINGSINKSKQWSVTLMPKQKGELLIPAIKVGSQQTAALKLQVLEGKTMHSADQLQDIFLEVKASSAEVFVQAQLILTVKLYRAVNLTQANLSEPEVPHSIMKRIGQDRNYETVVKQRRFVVTERSYALFPQKSGILDIPPLQFDGRISSGRSMFSQAGKAVRLKSEPVTVKVLAKPAIWDKSQTWLPAQELSLRELWADGQSTTYKVGEPFTRTIEIRATGLTAAQLPILFSAPQSDGFKQYPDQPVLNDEEGQEGIIGIRTEKVALIPTRAGEMTLPGLKIAWWNTRTQEVQTVMIASRVIDVLPADKISAATSAPPEPTAGQQLAVQSDESIHEQPVSAHKQDDSILWQVLALFFASAWVVTMLLWWFKAKPGQQLSTQSVEKRSSVKVKGLQRKLESACTQNNVTKVITILPEWGSAYFHDEHIHHFSQLKGRSDQLDDVLAELDQWQYGQAKQQRPWSGDKLLKLLSSMNDGAATEPAISEGLKMLYQ